MHSQHDAAKFWCAIVRFDKYQGLRSVAIQIWHILRLQEFCSRWGVGIIKMHWKNNTSWLLAKNIPQCWESWPCQLNRWGQTLQYWWRWGHSQIAVHSLFRWSRTVYGKSGSICSCIYRVLCWSSWTKVDRTCSLDAPCAQYFQGRAAVLACYHWRGSDTVRQPDGAQHAGSTYRDQLDTRIWSKQPGMTRKTCWLQHIHLFVPAKHHAIVFLQHRQSNLLGLTVSISDTSVVEHDLQ